MVQCSLSHLVMPAELRFWLRPGSTVENKTGQVPARMGLTFGGLVKGGVGHRPHRNELQV